MRGFICVIITVKGVVVNQLVAILSNPDKRLNMLRPNKKICVFPVTDRPKFRSPTLSFLLSFWGFYN